MSDEHDSSSRDYVKTKTFQDSNNDDSFSRLLQSFLWLRLDRATIAQPLATIEQRLLVTNAFTFESTNRICFPKVDRSTVTFSERSEICTVGVVNAFHFQFQTF